MTRFLPVVANAAKALSSDVDFMIPKPKSFGYSGVISLSSEVNYDKSAIHTVLQLDISLGKISPAIAEW